MNDNDLDEIMKKVFKREYSYLDKYQAVIEKDNLSEEELFNKYVQLLEAYRLLLQDTVKITKIGDINQKKLFEVNEEIEAQKRMLYIASITDPLTDVYNRTFLMEIIGAEFIKSKRYHSVFSCILIDIDDFKQINDSYGHLVGDTVLVKMAAVISSELRQADTFGRYGGEEFIVVLPNTSASEAAKVAEKIRKKIADTIFEEREYSLSLTISQGISDVFIDHPKSQDDFLYKVDTAMYQAKHQGKNCIVIYNGDVDSTFIDAD